MRIAQVAPLFVRIPPERYGGTERVVQALTEALVERGHEVSSLPPEEPEPRPCCTPRRLLRSGRWVSATRSHTECCRSKSWSPDRRSSTSSTLTSTTHPGLPADVCGRP